MNDFIVDVVENIPDKKLTVILPIKLTSDRVDALDRLSYFKLDSRIPDDVGFVVVDDGSEKSCSKKIRSYAKSHGIGYIKLDTELNIFSIAKSKKLRSNVL